MTRRATTLFPTVPKRHAFLGAVATAHRINAIFSAMHNMLVVSSYGQLGYTIGMTQQYPPIQWHLIQWQEPEPGIGCITLNRPDNANALSSQLAEELHRAVSSLPPHIRVLVLTGSGRHFCAGADLKERRGMNESQWHQQHHWFELALGSILECPLPVIAAVNGAAFGGGLELALACDFIYAAETARFALSETTLGIIPGMGGTQNLPRAVGIRRAKELIFTGKPFTASDAAHYGLVNEVCSASMLMEDVLACARRIADNAPLAVKAAKQAIQQGSHLSLAAGLACELAHYQSLLNTNDRHEGINAFNEKRKAAFTGT